MKLPRLNPVLVWCALSLYFVSSVLPAKGLVLCVGPSGSVAVESGAHSICECCDDTGNADSPAAGCSCLDIPVGMGMDGPQLGHRDRLVDPGDAAHLVPVAAVVAAVDVGMPRLPRAAPLRYRPPPGLSAIETVILVV